MAPPIQVLSLGRIPTRHGYVHRPYVHLFVALCPDRLGIGGFCLQVHRVQGRREGMGRRYEGFTGNTYVCINIILGLLSLYNIKYLTFFNENS